MGVTTWRVLGVALVGTLLAGCAPDRDGRGRTTVRFWAFGAEGENVQQLIPEFERRNPDLRVEVQQIPWSAAHEKVLTAFVGNSTPDVAQMGNTWIPEMVALDAVEPLGARVGTSRSIAPAAYFPGIWATNLIDGVPYGVPWYVDTRVMFYRTDILARAGYPAPPRTWAEWTDAMRRVKARARPGEFAVLMPLDEWAQPTILALQSGATLLKDDGRYAAFDDPAFRRAFDFYIGLFREGLAPAFANTQVGNVFQEFAAGRIAMYVTGPWNIGAFTERLPRSMDGKWATAPLPGPDGPASAYSLAGGASLVLFRASPHKDAAWRLLEYLAEPAQQRRFYALTGDLPARVAAWDDPTLRGNRYARAFYEQLGRVRPVPQVPEWELIATRLAQASEQAARGRVTPDGARAALAADVNRILEKRRWMLGRTASR